MDYLKLLFPSFTIIAACILLFTDEISWFEFTVVLLLALIYLTLESILLNLKEK